MQRFDFSQNTTGKRSDYFNLTTSQTGYVGDHYMRNQGDVVIGNSKEDRAFVSSFNASIDKQVSEFKKANPQMELDPKYIESLKLQVGDHLRYTSRGSGANPASFSIERGGNRVIQYSGHQEFGTSADIKQGQTEVA